MTEITIAIIGAILCLILLAYLRVKTKWDKSTQPPKGWMQHNGNRIRIRTK
jgi:hypothetical protein